MQKLTEIITFERYAEFIRKSFSFLITEFNYKLDEVIENGNIFYDISFKGLNEIISISLETYENYLRITIFELENGKLSNYDDKTKTIYLNILTKQIISKVSKSELEKNLLFFKEIKAETEIEKQIVKNAKELRLCMKFKQ